MKDCKILKDQVEEIVNNMIKDYMLTEIDTEALAPVPDVEFLKCAMGFHTGNCQYGIMRLWFQYIPNGRIFSLTFLVHTPDKCGPGISNQMRNIQEYTLIEKHGLKLAHLNDTDFALNAFLRFMDEKSLKDEPQALAVKRCGRALQAYSRENKFIQKLRKTDKYYKK